MLTRMEDARRQLLEGLTDPQREAVEHVDGPLLILAGPGSGKTRVVTRRAALLASTVTQPRHVLAITFTNKAAREMIERIDGLGLAPGMTVCTFHAFCAKLLRWHHDRAGIARNFTIFDRDDRRKVLKAAIEAAGLSTDNFSPSAVEYAISRAKNNLQTADEMAEFETDWRQKTFARIYSVYERQMADMEALDFDDLLMRVARLLKQDEDLCGQLQDRFRYVLVDEYQDTNAAQYAIAARLTERHGNLCATGDPDQSIYGWRGADIENILAFERDHPGAKVVRLEQNYRSTKRILSAADRLIAANASRKEKTLWTENDDGAAVRVVECEDGSDESRWIIEDLALRLREGTDSNDVAIFYRINAMSRAIEEALLRGGIAYQVARGVEFYNRKEIKDVLAYLRVLVNPADDISFLRIINTPTRGIGATTVQRLKAHAEKQGCRLFELLADDVDLGFLGRSASKVAAFAKLMQPLHAVVELPAPKALETVVSQSGLRAMYQQETGLDDAPRANLDELQNAAAQFQAEHPDATLLDWLEHAALISDIDGVSDEAASKVTLMTLHAAKGLEFGVVYIIGLEHGMLPFRRHDESDVDEEEERRLLFVGMTRAKRRLTLSRARYRMLRGVTQRTARSGFLDELPSDEVEWIRTEATQPRGRRNQASGRLPDDIAEWRPGTLVRHPSLGLGQILSLSRGTKRSHAAIQFENGKRESFVIEFADLTRVDFDDIG